MRVPSATRRAGFAVGVALAMMSAAAGAPAVRDAFDRAFPSVGEPALLHYRVLYRSADGVHRLEVWRERERRLRRQTDDALAIYAFRPNVNDPGYRMSVLDRKRRIHTLIDRVNLYRVGQFTDWYDLGHGLRRPQTAYRVEPGAAPARVPTLPAACRWYDLREGARTTRICWDARAHLPLEIADAQGRPLWRVLALDRGPFAPDTFAIHDRGYVRNDADQDISND